MSEGTTRLASALADRYRIERELGAGGMATVHLAEDVRHHRKVALKLLHPELSAVIGPERFLKEIELTANLQHPHILPLFDSGSADGQLYYVMPFVEGESLRGRLDRETQLPIVDALRIATEVADALQYAHGRGVVHRDIKPENILLHGGHALVADFGIALAVQHAGGQRLTQTGLSLGTPQYMSPEQAMGERVIDARSDVYALGAITYEMLAGEPPFTGPTAQAIVARVLSAAPPSITASRNTVPAHVEQAVLTALAKLPADRHASAHDFATALRAPALGNGAHVDASGARSATNRSHAGRRRAFGPLGIAVAVIALAATGAAGYLAGRSRDAASDAPIRAFGRATQVTWEPGLEVMPAISPDGKQVAYAAGTSTRMRLYVRPVAGGRATAVTDDTSAVETQPHWSRDGSRLLFISNGRVFSAPAGGGTGRQEVPDGRGVVFTVAWSPDERRIAFAAGDTVFVREADGAVRPLAPITGAGACDWGAGDLLACVSGNPWYLTPGTVFNNKAPSTVVAVRVSDGAVRVVSDTTSANQVPRWSADGRYLYYLSDRDGMRDLYAQRVDDGAPRGAPMRLTTGLGAHSFTFSADGSRLAYALLSASANVWSVPVDGAAGARAEQVTIGQQIVENGVVSRDGAWLYFDSNLAGNADLYRMRLPGGNPERLTFDAGDEFGPTASPDGREVAFHSFRSGSRDVYTLPLDGGTVATVTASAMEEGLPRWSPDGRAMVFSDLQLNASVHIVTRGADRRWSAARRLATGVFPAWSPDGRQIAYIERLLGGSLHVIGVDGGAVRTLFDASRGTRRALGAAWSDDGRSVYFKVVNESGDAELWSVAPEGGEPRRIAALGDARRRADRFDISFARGKAYVTLKEIESDIKVIEVVR